MKESLHSVLERSFAPYLPLTDRKNLSLKEQQTLYKLDFGKRRKCVSYQIDGNIIKTGNKCDFLILAKQEEDENNNNWKAIFVELKGTDVEHALNSLMQQCPILYSAMVVSTKNTLELLLNHFLPASQTLNLN